jgi:DNA-binding CsgD family transcriptional regulator
MGHGLARDGRDKGKELSGVRLTRAEHRVLERVMLGETNKEIAATLGCSPRTIEFHLSRIFRKTGTDCRTRLMSGVSMGRVRTEPPPALVRVDANVIAGPDGKVSGPAKVRRT